MLERIEKGNIPEPRGDGPYPEVSYEGRINLYARILKGWKQELEPKTFEKAKLVTSKLNEIYLKNRPFLNFKR